MISVPGMTWTWSSSSIWWSSYHTMIRSGHKDEHGLDIPLRYSSSPSCNGDEGTSARCTGSSDVVVKMYWMNARSGSNDSETAQTRDGGDDKTHSLGGRQDMYRRCSGGTVVIAAADDMHRSQRRTCSPIGCQSLWGQALWSVTGSRQHPCPRPTMLSETEGKSRAGGVT